MIKLVSINNSRRKYNCRDDWEEDPNMLRELLITDASDCEIVQLCFREGHAQLLAIDSLFCIGQWDLSNKSYPVI